MSSDTGFYLKDLTERVAKTFVQGALGAVGADQITSIDLSLLQSAGLGGAAAVLALLTGVVARYRGTRADASFLSR